MQEDPNARSPKQPAQRRKTHSDFGREALPPTEAGRDQLLEAELSGFSAPVPDHPPKLDGFEPLDLACAFESAEEADQVASLGFGLARARFSYVDHDEKKHGPLSHVVFTRPEAVAVLPVDQATREVILVQQLRIATKARGWRKGWLLEAPAGMVRDDPAAPGKMEAFEACARREVEEETGADVLDLRLHGWFWPSPGGSDERIHVYVADVQGGREDGEPAGVAKDGEHTVVRRIGVRAFLAMAEAGQFSDSKLIAAAAALRNEEAAIDDKAEVGSSACYRRLGRDGRPDKTGPLLVIQAGDIAEAEQFDVWVNSEDPGMRMARVIESAVSATIRRLGGLWSGDPTHEQSAMWGDFLKDRVGLALQDAVGVHRPTVGSVFETIPGELARAPWRVQRIFHVCAVSHRQTAETDGVKLCASRIFERIEAANRQWSLARVLGRRYRSALVPLLGAGAGKLPAGQSARCLLDAITAFYGGFKGDEARALRTIGLLCFTERERRIVVQLVEAGGWVRSDEPWPPEGVEP